MVEKIKKRKSVYTKRKLFPKKEGLTSLQKKIIRKRVSAEMNIPIARIFPDPISKRVYRTSSLFLKHTTKSGKKKKTYSKYFEKSFLGE